MFASLHTQVRLHIQLVFLSTTNQQSAISNPQLPFTTACYLQVKYRTGRGDGATTTILREGQSLGTFQEPWILDPMTPRTRQRMPPTSGSRSQPTWPGSAVALEHVQALAMTQAQWQQVLVECPRWDAREVRAGACTDYL